MRQGLVQIYTGSGKGKTTAALGLALRAAGHRLRVRIIAFMKGASYPGEIAAVERLAPEVTMATYGRDCPNASAIRQGLMECEGCGRCFVKPGDVTEQDRKLASMALEDARRSLESGCYDMVILDEIGNAVAAGLVSTQQVKDVLTARHPGCECVMTGRGFPSELVEAADLVTEMRLVRHPFEKGIRGRRGIEY